MFRIACTVVAGCLLGVPVFAAQPVKEAGEETRFLQEKLRALGADNPQAERLAAVEWLGRQRREPNRTAALQALERCVRTDGDVEVRLKAIEEVGMMALQRKPYVAPQALIDVLLDADAEVRSRALACCSLVKDQRFPPEALPTLLKVAEHADPNTRADGLFALGRTAPADPRARAALRKARADADDYVRYCAGVVWFRYVEDDAAGRLRFQARTIAEFRRTNERAEKSEQENQHRARRNLCILGMIFDWEERVRTSPAEAAAAIDKLLRDEDPSTRAAAASLLEFTATMRRETNKQREELDKTFRSPFLTPSNPGLPEPPKDGGYVFPGRLKLPGIEDGSSNTLIVGEPAGKKKADPKPPMKKPPATAPQADKKPDAAPERADPGFPFPSFFGRDMAAPLDPSLKELRIAGRLVELRERDPEPAVRRAAAGALTAMGGPGKGE